MVEVSVIIPAYNVESYLNECLDSVVNQTFRDLEIICVDDGSTDSTAGILEEWRKRDSRVIVLSQRNQGPGVARNAALAVACGEFIAFLDADDRLVSGSALRQACETAKDSKLDVLFAPSARMDESGNTLRDVDWLQTDLLPEGKTVFGPDDLGPALFAVTNLAPWGKVFRRQFLVDSALEFPPLRRSEDFPFVQLAFATAQRMGVMTESMIGHRTGDYGSLEGTKDETPLIFDEAEDWLWAQLRTRRLFDRFRDAARVMSGIRLCGNLNVMRTYQGLLAVANHLQTICAKRLLPADDIELDYRGWRKANQLIKSIHGTEDASRIIYEVLNGKMAKEASIRAFYEEAKAKSEERLRKLLAEERERAVAAKEESLKRFYEEAKARSEERLRKLLAEERERAVAAKEESLKRFYAGAKARSEARLRKLLAEERERAIAAKTASICRYYEGILNKVKSAEEAISP